MNAPAQPQPFDGGPAPAPGAAGVAADRAWGTAPSPGLDFGEPSSGAELHRRLGLILRQLDDALVGLGLMPRLARSAHDLPEVRGRLEWIVHKSGEAAHRTLSAVERAQAELERIEAIGRRLHAIAGAGDAAAAAIGELQQASARIGAELGDIMLAQDFHDLTGQRVAQVVALVLELEGSLLDLMLRSAPEGSAVAAPPRFDPAADADRVRDQREADELLAALGY